MRARTMPATKPISSSFEDYVQRDLIRLKNSPGLRHDTCGVEVISGSREVSFYPFLNLNDTFEKYPQHFADGYPLAGFGPWQRPSIFRPYTGKRGESPLKRLVAVRCDQLSLLYITSANTCSSLLFARRQNDKSAAYPPLSQWKRLEGLEVGDIVSLAAGAVFATKSLNSLLVTDEEGINTHLEQRVPPAELNGEKIDAAHAGSLVTRPSDVKQVSDAKITHATQEGIVSDFIQLGDSGALQVEYGVNGAYALLATLGRNARLASHRAQGKRNELELATPPSGCIVRGGTTLSISGLDSVLILSRAK